MTANHDRQIEALAIRALTADADLKNSPPVGSVGANALLQVSKSVDCWIDGANNTESVMARTDAKKRYEAAEEVVLNTIGRPEDRIVWTLWVDLSLYERYQEKSTMDALTSVKHHLGVLAEALILRRLEEQVVRRAAGAF